MLVIDWKTGTEKWWNQCEWWYNWFSHRLNLNYITRQFMLPSNRMLVLEVLFVCLAQHKIVLGTSTKTWFVLIFFLSFFFVTHWMIVVCGKGTTHQPIVSAYIRLSMVAIGRPMMLWQYDKWAIFSVVGILPINLLPVVFNQLNFFFVVWNEIVLF